MKNLLIIIVASLFCNGNKNSIIGEYFFASKSDNVSYRLALMKGKFIYRMENGLTRLESSGKWYVRKDTLVIKSYYQQAFKIKVKETKEVLLGIQVTIENNTEDRQFFMIYKTDSDSALIFLTKDTILKDISDLRSFRVGYGSNMISENYFVKKRTNNSISISVPKYELFDDYISLKNKKYLIIKDGLISLSEKNKRDSILVDLNTLVEVKLIQQSE